MPFEKFVKNKIRHPRRLYPFATLPVRPIPRITFNKPCADWMKEDGFSKVLYLYDKELNLIAFQKSPDGCGYTLHYNGNQAYVSARLFLEHIGNYDPGRYDASYDIDNKMVVVDMNKKIKGQ